MQTETTRESNLSTGRLLSALAIYLVLGGILSAAALVRAEGESSEIIAIAASALLLVPFAVLLALKTARVGGLRPVAQAIGALAVIGMVVWTFSDMTTTFATAIVCIAFPAAFFAAVWLGPAAERERAR